MDGTNAVFVIVVRLDQIKESEEQLSYWLRFIKSRMTECPSLESRPTVILVGSGRDSVNDSGIVRKNKDDWSSDWGKDKLQQV